MITQKELHIAIDKLDDVQLLHGQVMVLVPDVVDEEIIDGDTAKVKEVPKEKGMITFFPVIKVASDINYIKLEDRVYPQGTVTTLKEEVLPEELKDIAPEGFMLGLTHATYIKIIL